MIPGAIGVFFMKKQKDLKKSNIVNEGQKKLLKKVRKKYVEQKIRR